MSSDTCLLELHDISHRFGDVLALDAVSMTLAAGTIHALLGENGAGKSTLMRVAFGMLTSDRGRMHVRGMEHRPRNPAQAINRGIGMVHQHFTLVPNMTVAENISLGGHGLFNPAKAAEHVIAISKRSGLSIAPHAVVGTLPVSAQQRCEILKALSRDASILILDEPTAVLAPDESRDLLTWLRAYADKGNGVVLITHKLRDALAVADEFTVLRHGRVTLNAPRSEVTEDQLAAAMLGRSPEAASEVSNRGGASDEAGHRSPAEPVDHSEELTQPATVVAAVHNLHAVDERGVFVLRDVSLALHTGEIVGVAAVEGSGQHQLLRVMSGRIAPVEGRAEIPDRIGFIPEDRHRDALLVDDSLVSNVALRGAGERRGRMRWKSFVATASRVVSEFDVRTASIDVPARTLSGGNQQKLVVGRELIDDPPLLVVENPTRGLDFNATRAVHSALRKARDAGTAVLFYSSDLDEVLQLSDRVVVLREGRLNEVERDRELVGREMLTDV